MILGRCFSLVYQMVYIVFRFLNLELLEVIRGLQNILHVRSRILMIGQDQDNLSRSVADLVIYQPIFVFYTMNCLFGLHWRSLYDWQERWHREFRLSSDEG